MLEYFQFIMIELQPGTAIGFGGTNARSAAYLDGEMVQFSSIATPDSPDQFFSWMAHQALTAADDGSKWLVAGYPGPVTADGKLVGPMVNVKGVSETQFDLRDSLTTADPAVGRLLEAGFMMVAVNDGELAAQAVAKRVGADKERVGAIIIGTGQGAGVVQKDPRVQNVHRSMPGAISEIGHIPLSVDPRNSFENDISGTALERRYGVDPRVLPMGHQAWNEVGAKVVQLAAILGLMYGVELVAPTGGVGIGASENYRFAMDTALRTFEEHANKTQKQFMPEIVLINPSEAHEFEMHGAPGVVRDFSTRTDLHDANSLPQL